MTVMYAKCENYVHNYFLHVAMIMSFTQQGCRLFEPKKMQFNFA